MAKEFDVYLHKRLTECDVYVYSLTLREGLTAVYRMILDSHVDSITMRRFGGGGSAMEIGPAINGLTKTSHESIESEIKVLADVGFLKQTSASPESNTVVLEPRLTEIFSYIPFGAESSAQIGVDPILPQTGLSPGRVSLSALLDVSDVDFFKTGILEIVPQLVVAAEVSGTKKVTKVSVRADLDFSASVSDLNFRLYTGGSSSVQMDSAVLDTEISHSFGRMGSDMSLCSELLGDGAFEVGIGAEAGLFVGAEASSVLSKVILPQVSGSVIEASADLSMKRRRLLSEMDESALSAFDDMTLHDVDYVTVS